MFTISASCEILCTAMFFVFFVTHYYEFSHINFSFAVTNRPHESDDAPVEERLLND
jgi:hypothetical protein